MSSRSTSPPPVRPSPQRVFSPPPRVRSPPPLAPAPRVFSPTHATSPPPGARIVSPPPILNILPSTPVQHPPPDSTQSAAPPDATPTATSEPAPKLPGSKGLDAIHEVVETGDGSESENGQKVSSNSSSLILPTSPQGKPAVGATLGPPQPLEGQRSMTVEVTSTPQAQLAPPEKDKSTTKVESGLKSARSNDTMKPPAQTRPRKKRSRTANIANTNSSKAEIFAAKVAAVVGANPDTSDSEEAFVYDSSTANPPNQNTSTKTRPAMHSRTPSMTSINSAYTGSNPTYGTVPAGRGRGSNDEGYNFPTMTRAQHRSLQQKNASSGDENRRRTILPEDSPFTLHVKIPARNAASPQPPRTLPHPPRGSPRTKSTVPRNNIVKTPKWAQSQFYDGDDTDDGDPFFDSSNERVPLIPRDMNRSTRRVKAYKSRARVPSAKQQSQIQANYERRRNNRFARAPKQPTSSQCWPGLAGTAILACLLLILTMLTVGFVFQTSRSLENVTLTNVTNIVVSQEELIMDILVEAGNPNFLPVVVGEKVSIDIFARSDHFDDPSKSHSHRERRRSFSFWPPWDSDPPDHKTPPHNVTEGTSLLLGTVHWLEAPLSFPSTSFKRIPYTTQKGQMKLLDPAVNATDGPEKWKKCIQWNFELIVRGTMKYRAPIGGRERAVAVEWRGTVDPLGNRIWNGDSWVE